MRVDGRWKPRELELELLSMGERRMTKRSWGRRLVQGLARVGLSARPTSHA